MAISKKIPSPQEIKNAPVKFTPQEIEEINQFNIEFSNRLYYYSFR